VVVAVDNVTKRITTVDGNYGGAVTLRSNIDPTTATSGTESLTISGYVRVPAA
jgi:hypothetical protein